MPETADDESDDTTISTQARDPRLGTALALIVVPMPWVLAFVYLSLDNAIPWWLWLVLVFEPVAGTVWWVGAGAASTATELIGSLGGS